MSPAERFIRRLAGQGIRARRSGSGWVARCPVHEADGKKHKPSLSVGEGRDGRALIVCMAGCPTEDVLAALGLTWADVQPPRDSRREQEAYSYTDAQGTPLFEVVRYLDPKEFKQRLPDGRWGLHGVKPVLYRLPKVVEAVKAGRRVFVVEGERDVHNLERHGFTATTNPMGALKWKDRYTPTLKGAHVVILPDNDQPGRDHARQVAAAVSKVTADVRVLELPGLADKGDVTDWFRAGHTANELKQMVADTPPWDGSLGRPASNGWLRACHVCRQPVHWLWRDWLPLGKLVLLEGDPAVGKSTLTLDLGARITTGRDMPDGTNGHNPAAVIIMTAEDGLADTVRPRLEAAGADLDRVLLHNEDTVALSLPSDLESLEKAVVAERARLVIIDPLVAFLDADVNANRDQDIRRALRPLAAMAERTGACVVTLRHLNKGRGLKAMYRGGGSIGIIGGARLALLAAQEPGGSGRRVLAVVKSNLAPEPQTMAYRLVASSEVLGVARVSWDGTSRLAADELVDDLDRHERAAQSEAETFLQSLLTDGPVSATDARRQARSLGIADRTLDRAKAALGVHAFKVGFGAEAKWHWHLTERSDGPLRTPKDAKDHTHGALAPFGDLPSTPQQSVTRGHPGSPENDRCSQCPNQVEVVGGDGLNYCRMHAPESERWQLAEGRQTDAQV